jgi:hypothetical protein
METKTERYIKQDLRVLDEVYFELVVPYLKKNKLKSNKTNMYKFKSTVNPEGIADYLTYYSSKGYEINYVEIVRNGVHYIMHLKYTGIRSHIYTTTVNHNGYELLDIKCIDSAQQGTTNFDFEEQFYLQRKEIKNNPVDLLQI